MPFEPLVCDEDPILTVAFAEAVKVATNFVIFVPVGTVAVIVVSFIVAIMFGVSPVNPNAVIAFSEDLGAVPTVTITT